MEQPKSKKLKKAKKLKKPATKSETIKSQPKDIDELFKVLQSTSKKITKHVPADKKADQKQKNAPKTENKKNNATKLKKPQPSEKKVEQRQYTEEGYPIYTPEELGIGKGTNFLSFFFKEEGGINRCALPFLSTNFFLFPSLSLSIYLSFSHLLGNLAIWQFDVRCDTRALSTVFSGCIVPQKLKPIYAWAYLSQKSWVSRFTSNQIVTFTFYSFNLTNIGGGTAKCPFDCDCCF